MKMRKSKKFAEWIDKKILFCKMAFRPFHSRLDDIFQTPSSVKKINVWTVRWGGEAHVRFSFHYSQRKHKKALRKSLLRKYFYSLSWRLAGQANFSN